MKNICLIYGMHEHDAAAAAKFLSPVCLFRPPQIPPFPLRHNNFDKNSLCPPLFLFSYQIFPIDFSKNSSLSEGCRQAR